MERYPPCHPATPAQRVALLAVLILGGVLFALNASPFPFPGQPTTSVSDVGQLTPFVLRSNFLWQQAGRFADLVLPGSLTAVLSVMSAVCGVLALALLYWFNRLCLHDPERSATPAIISTVAATALLATCEPFVVAASRPGPGTFDAALLLAGAVVTMLCLQGIGKGRLVLAGVLYGLAAVETPFALLFLPVGCAVLIIALARHRQLAARPVLLVVLPMVFVGAGLMLAICWGGARHPYAAHWEIDSTMGMVVLTAKQYIKTLRSGIPRVGWLIILVTSAVPWILLRGAIRPLKVHGSQFILLISLSIIGVGLHLNLDFAPAQILGENRYLVLPTVIIASWLGFLLYLFMRKIDELCRPYPGRRVPLQWALCLAVFMATAGYAIWNTPHTRAGQGSFLARTAAYAVDDLPAGTTVVAGGEYARHLQIAALQADKDLSIVDMALMQFTPYQRYLRAQYQSVRQQSLVQMGIVPFFRGLIEEAGDGGASLATVLHGELFSYGGIDPLPWGAYYGPGDLESAETVSSLTNRVARYWAWFDKNIPRPADVTHDALTGWAAYLQTAISKQANNFGVVCQDLGLQTQAFEAYTRSRDHNANNISALLNKYRLAMELKSVETDALRTELEREAKGYGSSMAVWRLSNLNGFVRDPFFFRDMGMTWALSGRRAHAIKQLEHAAELGARGGGVRSMLGSLYMAANELEKSEKQYSVILEHRPDHPAALIGMARLLVVKQDYELAESYLARAEKAGVPFVQVGMEMVALRIAAGRVPEAIGLLQQLRKSYPDEDMPAVMLAFLLASSGSLDEANTVLSTISVADLTDANQLVLAGGIYRLMNRGRDAEHVFQRAVQAQPGNLMALEQVIELRLIERDFAGALAYAKTILVNHPRHATAHYVIGLNYQMRGENELARNAYEVCLEERDMPEAMNNLAWILNEAGDVDAAIRLATRSAKLTPEAYSPWDTLGYALLRKGDYESSAKALLKALELEPQQLEVNLHILELFIVQDKMSSAEKLAGKLQGRLSDMSSDQLSRYQRLRVRLDTTLADS